MRKTLAMFTAVSLCAFLLTPVSGARAQNSAPSSQQERHATAIHIARAINTAEANLGYKQGGFLSLQQLLDAGPKGVSADPGSSPGKVTISRYFVRLMVSEDRKSYSFTLHDTEDKKCYYTVFSDQEGVIYQGLALDCPLTE